MDYLVRTGSDVVFGQEQVSFDLSNDVFSDAGVGGDLRNVGRAGAYGGVSSFFSGAGSLYVAGTGPAACPAADACYGPDRVRIRR